MKFLSFPPSFINSEKNKCTFSPFSKLENHDFLHTFAPIWSPQNKVFSPPFFNGSTMAQMKKRPFSGSSFPMSYARSTTSRPHRLSVDSATHLPQDFTTTPRAGLQEDGSLQWQNSLKLPTSYYLLLTTYHLLLTTYYLPLTTYYVLLTT